MNQKNYDPHMHTIEHILNGVMVRRYGKGRSFSQSIERRKSKCDYAKFDRNLTDTEIEDIQNEINTILSKNIDVTEEFISKEQAKKEYNLEKLPLDAGEDIRIVKIGEFDACPCIGPHVKNTNEIDGVRIISSSFENDVLRIRFKRIKKNWIKS